MTLLHNVVCTRLGKFHGGRHVVLEHIALEHGAMTLQLNRSKTGWHIHSANHIEEQIEASLVVDREILHHLCFAPQESQCLGDRVAQDLLHLQYDSMSTLISYFGMNITTST